ncbi:hypothetical protein GCM10009824_18300 [Kocuria atrinae]|uniref:Transposase n=1 Tax=Kocuria atrinae TaxID=592377 RepID=A0ABN2XWU3_9MICC
MSTVSNGALTVVEALTDMVLLEIDEREMRCGQRNYPRPITDSVAWENGELGCPLKRLFRVECGVRRRVHR